MGGADLTGDLDGDVADLDLELPDGRRLGWTETGPRDGIPVLRLPGTPGSRWVIRADREPWRRRGLRVITTERPGFGRSTPLLGRGFIEHADDLAVLLDHLELDRVRVYGASGAAPHILAFAARHPGRVEAATVISGAAPLLAEERDQLIPINRRGYELAGARDVEGVRQLLDPVADSLRADPLAGFRALMATAPPADHAVMNNPDWQSAFVRAMHEAVAQGTTGWVDETLAVFGDWHDVELGAVATPLTWFHTAEDRNVPLSAARRLVGEIPAATLVVWPEGGHFAAYHREDEVLDDLLSRGGGA